MGAFVLCHFKVLETEATGVCTPQGVSSRRVQDLLESRSLGRLIRSLSFQGDWVGIPVEMPSGPRWCLLSSDFLKKKKLVSLLRQASPSHCGQENNVISRAGRDLSISLIL